MTRRAAAIRAVATATILLVVDGFAPFPIARRIRGGTSCAIGQQVRDRPTAATCSSSSSSSSLLRSSNGGNGDGEVSADEEARRLREKADRYRNEAERLRLALGMRKIDKLESDIREFAIKGDDDDGTSSGKKLQELKDRVENLVRGSVGNEEADGMLLGLSSFSSSRAVPSPGGEGGGSTSSPDDDVDKKEASFAPPTDEEVKNAIAFLDALSAPLKNALAMAAGYKRGYDSIPNKEGFVRDLYQQSDVVSTERLRGLYSMQRIKAGDVSAYESSSSTTKRRREKNNKDDEEEYEISGMSKLLASKIEERLENTTRAMELFPRSLQDADEDVLPTKEDANVVFQLLEKNFMATERPVKVRGGYIIRGTNKRKSSGELLDALDGKLVKANPKWLEKYQISHVEIYSDANEELFEDAILITPNKFVPIAPGLLSAASSAIAVFMSFVFCIDAFGENAVVMERLREASEVASAGGSYDLIWFNELLVPLLLTLGAAQGVHELSHILAAWSKQVKLTTPTILPSLGLPYLSFQNRIKTSPKGYADLFDIAFVGPLAGLSFSFVALLVGLQLTTTVDPSTAQLLPSLPVGYLTQSTLAGTIVDLILGGGDGILLNQDATTQVPLHPVAIGGFLGLIIHALDLVPVGSTDGGRMSQAILGRVWHLTFSSLVFLVLFISSFTSDSSILLGYLFIYSFTQRDMEIPCRNEVDKVELPRAVAALVTWLLAALILVPLR